MPLTKAGSALAIGKEFSSIGPLGSVSWLFKEDNCQISPKIEANWLFLLPKGSKVGVKRNGQKPAKTVKTKIIRPLGH